MRPLRASVTFSVMTISDHPYLSWPPVSALHIAAVPVVFGMLTAAHFSARASGGPSPGTRRQHAQNRWGPANLFRENPRSPENLLTRSGKGTSLVYYNSSFTCERLVLHMSPVKMQYPALRMNGYKALVYTMRELNQQTARIMGLIERTGKSAFITRHGWFIALITPLAPGQVESRVLTAMARDLGKLH